MTDRPILFSAPMVRALIEGSKTQTRRMLKLRRHKQFSEFGPSDTPGYDWHFRRADGCWCDHRQSDLPLPYAIGDRLWVKETWRTHRRWDAEQPSAIDATRVWHEADERDNCDQHGKVRPAIYMPRWASRLTLTVTDVRVQRLQDISEADAIAEGVKSSSNGSGVVPDGYWMDYSVEQGRIWVRNPIKSYATLWNSIHGRGAWQANPWVTAISFDVEQRNIDA
ncbi:hypothetical protein GV829_04525 [Sphingomonas lacunae]|uniref:Morphogenetic protein n=1 Tax=Sphingomonas lacunae TaxID=2698828 RepID=A0A6M4ATP9_9SPHN|nr:hypothetical protein [Sphingomonas lacunae]QJQ31800.1 hypothetical protein GV829_04525 [Sphingomonas lacunae]